MTALMFPASILLNRALGAEDRGLLALVLLIPSTIFTVGSCQWDRVVQGLIASGSISSSEAWRRTTYYAARLTIFVVPAGIVASLLYAPLGGEGKILSAVYSFSFPVYFLCGCLSAILLAAGSINGQYAMRLAYQGSYLVLVALLLATHTISVPAMVLVHFLIHLCNLVTGLVLKQNALRGPTSSDTPSFKPLRRAFGPYFLESLAGRADIWVLSFLAPMSVVGQYTGIAALMMPVGLLSNALTSASTARLDWTSREEIRNYLRRVSMVLGLLTIALLVGSLSGGAAMLRSLLGDSFADGAWMLPWIALIVVAQAASVQFHTALRLSGRELSYLRVQGFDAILRCLSVAVCGYVFGVPGVIASSLFSSFLKVLLCASVFRSGRENF